MRTVICNHCDGCGEVDTFDLYEVKNGRIKCPTCEGEGKIYLGESRINNRRTTYSDRRSNICNRP
jgi:uncharacterized Zn finger protein (UPF0148 family)